MSADIQRQLVSMRLPSELKQRLQEAAALDHRSMTDLVIAVMSCWLDGRRYEPVARLSGPSRAPAKLAAYQATRGRPRAANDELRQEWLIEALQRKFQPDQEATLDELVASVSDGNHAPNFERTVENQLPHLDWISVTRTSDGASVWIGPQHRFRVTKKP